MKQAIKFGVYVAAGVGAFEILRRTGLLAKAGEWLQEQVPESVKDRARRMGEQVVDQVHQAEDRLQSTAARVRDKAGHFISKAHEAADNGVAAASEAVNTFNGKTELTADSDGASIPHQVGRGIIH